MARVDNLNNFLTDVADSIRNKTGKTGKISASNFDSEISSITTSENLDTELAAYNSGLTTQENSLSGIVQYLEDKIASGGEGSGPYTPKYISFYQCSEDNLDYEVSNIDTSNIETMNSMFESCQQITSLDLSHWNTSKALRMQRMFWTCIQLTDLNLSSWDTSQVLDMQGMFYGCSSLKKLDIRGFTFSKVGSWMSMFGSVPSDCLIIVKDETAKNWVLNAHSDFTNVKTVAELEG